MSSLPLFADDAPFQARPLRDHQHRGLHLLRAELRNGSSRPVLEMPTGAGKTRLAAEIITRALVRGKRVCFTVPAITLINQTVEAFESEGILCLGVIQAAHPRTDPDQPVQVASVQTLMRRDLPEFDLVLVDECHLQFEFIEQWMERCPETIFVGLSATPWARGMANHWDRLVKPTSMAELIELGFLSPFRVYAPSHPDLSKVRTQAGDYHEGELAEVMGDAQLVADVVTTWKQLAENRPTLVFAVDRAHARKLQEQFGLAGVRMGYCDANTDIVERHHLFKRVARGELAGIVNIGTLTTGVDADIRCIVMARPTKSEILFVQCIGRGLRTASGKADCLILDHSDNHLRLGFVTDIHHDALIAKGQRTKGTKEREVPLPRECPKCHALKPAKVRQCPECGFAPQRQCDVEIGDGKLAELKPGKRRYTREQKQRFWSMAICLGEQRGKRKPFSYAKAMYKEKFGVWPKDLHDQRLCPDHEFLQYERSRRIAYAKALSASERNGGTR